jgi:hypothetical protein
MGRFCEYVEDKSEEYSCDEEVQAGQKARARPAAKVLLKYAVRVAFPPEPGIALCVEVL